MFVSARHIHLHLPKTGGTWAAYLLYATLGGDRIGYTHDPAWRALGHLDGREAFGLVRDPWSWYVSVYVHAANTSGLDRLARYGNGSHSGRGSRSRRAMSARCCSS